MVPVLSLIVPILVASVLVFLASFVLHMVLPFHRNDVRKAPNEDAVLDAFRRLNLASGDYAVPCASSPGDMKKKEFVEKIEKGPVVFMTVIPRGSTSMTKELVLWFIYTIVVGIFAAYITGRARPAGTHYLEIFRFAGASAFMGYSLALLQHSIWYKRNWGTTVRGMIDGLIYALLTAGTFGWLWPTSV